MTQWGLDTLFNPAKRHMDEEKRRLQSTREEIGDNSGGKRIDLESGKVRIRPAGAEDADGADGADTTDSADSADNDEGAHGRVRADGSDTTDGKDRGQPPVRTATGKRSHGKSPKGEPSPAAIRAAQRRGRQAR